jgi:type VI secretion system secreted protein VgrG
MKNLVFRCSKVFGVMALSSILVLAGLLLVVQQRAYATTLLPVQLGKAGNYSVFGGTGAVNTLTTTLNADLGVGSGYTISGFGSPSVVGGQIHAGDAAAVQAQSDLAAAYSSAANLTATSAAAGDQIGVSFGPGVYNFGAAIGNSGTMTLNGGGDPNAVFVFQVNGAITPAASSSVVLTNGAQASNVFWQVNGAVSTGASSSFSGNIMADGAITIGAGGSLHGRALATGTVTLSNNVIITPDIVSFESPPTPTSALTSTTTDSALATGTPGDAGAISYASTTGSVCSVSTNGALTYVGVGTCTIAATQGGDSPDGYTSATADISFPVTAPPAYAVTFNGNGSTSGATAPETDNVPSTLTPNGFVRTGYAFSGWNTVALGGGTAYADGATYPFTAAVTLYAQWTANPAGGGSTSPAPSITAISPALGPTAGGASVVINGTNFSGASVVRFGSIAAFNVIVVNSTTITAVSPAGAAGLINVTVTTAGGTSPIVAADTFTNTNPALIILIQGSPNAATVAGGEGYSGQRNVTNAAGIVSYTETVSGDSTDVVVSSTGKVTAADSLSPGIYSVSGYDGDTSGDTGTWAFTLTVMGTTRAAPASGDYDLVGSDGGVFVFGQPGTGFYGSLPGIGVHVNDIVGMVPTGDKKGYYLVGSDGGVFAFGDATFDGSLPGIGVHVDDIVGITPTADSGGYFLVGKDGGIFAFGNAAFDGSLPGIGIRVTNIVSFATTPNGQGYWVVGSSGDVYAFGSAPTLGNAPSGVASMAATPSGEGYWVAGPDGGVFTFGDASFEGSLPGAGIACTDIVSIVPTSDGKGYLLAGADGGVFTFGDASFEGSLPGIGIHVTDIVGAVSTS